MDSARASESSGLFSEAGLVEAMITPDLVCSAAFVNPVR